ncbi:hypothetical protein [Salinisphaera sp.]|uniref:hypothetical protein n=1 Tax=Salinisphaera sp. TaxID=1914330 RepID=UPI002D79FAD1|nr:hypothetical protein [Salinisphaera sp.]HET7314395.1 hypothetical protein [Salinisphaera sp.]
MQDTTIESPINDRTSPEHGHEDRAEHAPLIGNPEPWAAWETRLVLWSLGFGLGGLVVLGLVVHLVFG